MNPSDDILDPSQLYFDGDFDSQVENILYHVRLTAGEVQNLTYLFSDLENALKALDPGIKVLPFGSIVTGLGIKTSDVDCYIALPGRMRSNPNIVIHARNVLRKHYKIFTNLFAITSAKVPIVKFLHIPTNCNCDINFKSLAGVQNSQLICYMLKLDGSDRALHLAILIKYWSKVHKITGTNLLASYALTLMVIFYLQLMNMLPSIIDMQRYVPPYFVDGWNTGFDYNINVNLDYAESLYDLVGGFFKCYSNLNFEDNIISPYMGRLLQRKIFHNLNDIPKEYIVYKKNLATGSCKPLQINTPVCVQDPFEHCKNASASVHPRLAARLKGHFQFAAQMFDELPSNQFLEAILAKDPNAMTTVNAKRKRKPVFHNKVMKHKHKIPQNGLNNLNRRYEKIRGMMNKVRR